MTCAYIYDAKRNVSKNDEINKKKREFAILKILYCSYGCQMNVSDSEVVASILEQIGYSHTNELHESDLILLNLFNKGKS